MTKITKEAAQAAKETLLKTYPELTVGLTKDTDGNNALRVVFNGVDSVPTGFPTLVDGVSIKVEYVPEFKALETTTTPTTEKPLAETGKEFLAVAAVLGDQYVVQPTRKALRALGTYLSKR
jgi:hypothetical protein